MVIPPPILELIKFRVTEDHKFRAVLGAEMYSLENAISAGLMDEVVAVSYTHLTLPTKA